MIDPSNHTFYFLDYVALGRKCGYRRLELWAKFPKLSKYYFCRIVCKDTAVEDETLNLHVTASTTFQDEKLQDIRRKILLDPQLVKLAKVIQNGWGDNRGDLDPDLHAFWIHRFNMHIDQVLVQSNNFCILIPFKGF